MASTVKLSNENPLFDEVSPVAFIRMACPAATLTLKAVSPVPEIFPYEIYIRWAQLDLFRTSAPPRGYIHISEVDVLLKYNVDILIDIQGMVSSSPGPFIPNPEPVRFNTPSDAEIIAVILLLVIEPEVCPPSVA